MRILILCMCLVCFARVSRAEVNLDGEEIPDGEAEAIAQVVQLIGGGVAADARAEGHAYRDAHRKAHGCVKAEFAVLRDLPSDFAQGVFKPGQKYDAIIRYSNGSGKSQDDHAGDGRGMAVKLLGVTGPKLLEEEAGATTQDFLMINHPVFFVRNAPDYVGFQKASMAGGASFAWWLTEHALHEGWIALAILRTKITNPLNSRYWSMTPSKLGPKQMKFSAEPCAGGVGGAGPAGGGPATGADAQAAAFAASDTSDSADLLRENMQSYLNARAACFDFKIQLRGNPKTMPVEDPTIEWDEKVAPFVTVARITIPVQTLDAGVSCEALSYTPWHAVTENRPLGGISRARKEVYRAISGLRHEVNGQPRVEP